MTTPSRTAESSEEPRGFAGLTSLVSQLPETPKAPLKPATGHDWQTAPSVAAAQKGAETPRHQAPPRPGPAEIPTKSRGSIWLRRPAVFWLVLAAIGAFIYVGNMSNPAGPPHPASDPLFAQPARQAAAPPQAKPYIPPPPADLPVLAEVRPAGGVNPILSVQEILYCLSEEIRMDAMQAILTDPSQGQINSFNARVGDFNARCTAYRYYNNDMDRARTIAASRKSSLQAEAQRIVSGWR